MGIAPRKTGKGGNTIGKTVGQTTSTNTSAKKANPALTKQELDDLQLLIDLAGTIPGVGSIASILNAVIDVARGNLLGAAFNAFAALPLFGNAAKGVKIAKNIDKYIAAINRVKKTVINKLPPTQANQLRNVIAKIEKHLKSQQPNPAKSKTTNKPATKKASGNTKPPNNATVKKKNQKPKKQCPTCPATKKPVNPIQGCKFLSGDEDTDFVLTGPLPLIWDRQYASNSPIGGNNTDDPIGFYGQGFGTPFSLSLNIRPNDDLIELVDAYGRIIPFPYMDVGSSFYSRFEDIRLHHDAQGRYRLTSGSSPKGDGIALHFGEGDDTLLYPSHASHLPLYRSKRYLWQYHHSKLPSAS